MTLTTFGTDELARTGHPETLGGCLMCFELILAFFLSFSSHSYAPSTSSLHVHQNLKYVQQLIFSRCKLMGSRVGGVSFVTHSPADNSSVRGEGSFHVVTETIQASILLQRCQHHEHRTPFHLGRLFNLADVRKFFSYFL